MKVIHQLKEVSRTVISSLKLSLKVNLCLLMVRFTVINQNEVKNPLLTKNNTLFHKYFFNKGSWTSILQQLPY